MSGDDIEEDGNLNFNDCITKVECNDLFEQIRIDMDNNAHATKRMFTTLTQQLNAMDGHLTAIEQRDQDDRDEGAKE